MKIDQPSGDGGTTSNTDIARLCFLDINHFFLWIKSLIPLELHNALKVIHTNLSVILHIFNSEQEVSTERLDVLCKETYESIIISFPWAHITPFLHKLLAHCPELIRVCWT